VTKGRFRKEQMAAIPILREADRTAVIEAAGHSAIFRAERYSGGSFARGGQMVAQVDHVHRTVSLNWSPRPAPQPQRSAYR